MPDLRVWCWVSLNISYKRVLLENVASIMFDRDSLLPFNPTYALSNVNTPYFFIDVRWIDYRLLVMQFFGQGTVSELCYAAPSYSK